jgi:hypothetical protein
VYFFFFFPSLAGPEFDILVCYGSLMCSVMKCQTQ